MGSEPCALLFTLVIVYVLMLSGIFYSESVWLDASPQRLDLLVIFSCLVFMAPLTIILTTPQNKFEPHTVFFVSFVYSHFGMVCLGGLQMIVGLIVWKQHSDNSDSFQSGTEPCVS